MTEPLTPELWADAFTRRWMQLSKGNADPLEVHEWALTLAPPDGLGDPAASAEIEFSMLD